MICFHPQIPCAMVGFVVVGGGGYSDCIGSPEEEEGMPYKVASVWLYAHTYMMFVTYYM